MAKKAATKLTKRMHASLLQAMLKYTIINTHHAQLYSVLELTLIKYNLAH